MDTLSILEVAAFGLAAGTVTALIVARVMLRYAIRKVQGLRRATEVETLRAIRQIRGDHEN